MDSQMNKASKTAQEKIRTINFTVREKMDSTKDKCRDEKKGRMREIDVAQSIGG